MKKLKKIFAFVLTIVLIMVLIPLGSFTARAEKPEGESEALGATYKVGDIIKFGHYEQDGNTANGKEEIEWEVIKVESDRVLVISKYALDCKPYNTKYSKVNWATCSLREWLNNDFKNAAFTSDEQLQIPMVTLLNENNPFYEDIWGISETNTEDQIFCLSLSEIKDLFGYSWYDPEIKTGWSQKSIVEPTQYAIDNGAYLYTITEDDYYDESWSGNLISHNYTPDVIGKRCSSWWLRTPSRDPKFTCDVWYDGRVGTSFYDAVNEGRKVVRPAMYIKYSSTPVSSGIFADVKEGTWQYNAAKAVYDKGYMTGKGKSGDKIIFAPNTPVTRAEFVQILFSVEGKPSTVYKQQFSDVKLGDWFASAVTWAANNKIVAGNPNGTFGVTGKATREQLALMFYKYADFKGYDTTIYLATGKTVDNFPDANLVSPWAKNALNWALSRGIISGTGAGKLNPSGSATRAECAAMLNSFLNAYENSTPGNDFEQKIKKLREEYPEGKYWNHKVDAPNHTYVDGTHYGDCSNITGSHLF